MAGAVFARNRCSKQPYSLTNVEALESRRMFANAALAVAMDAGVLRISGTDQAEAIFVSRTGNTWKVTNGTWLTTVKGSPTRLQIKAGAGDDLVSIDTSVFTPARIFGNSGNDTLRGGSGADSIYGHAGNDSISGNGGNDVLIGIGGGLRDSLVGGDGDDSFWLDSGGSENVIDPSAGENRNAAVHRIGAFQSIRGQAIGKELSDRKTNLPDPSSKHAGGKWASFSSMPLFAATGPVVDDVRQGSLGDCYVHAPLAAVARANPMRVRETLADLGDGTFAVRMTRGATNVYYRIDADLPVYSWSATTAVYAKPGTQNALWAPLFEKAFALFRTGAGSYESIGDGGWFDETYGALGIASNDRFNAEFSSGKALIDQIELDLVAGKMVTIATDSIADDTGSLLVGGHAYTVIKVVRNSNGTKSIVVRNPWGVDGANLPSGDANDGYITLNAAQTRAGTMAFSSARL